MVKPQKGTEKQEIPIKFWWNGSWKETIWEAYAMHGRKLVWIYERDWITSRYDPMIGCMWGSMLPWCFSIIWINMKRSGGYFQGQWWDALIYWGIILCVYHVPLALPTGLLRYPRIFTTDNKIRVQKYLAQGKTMLLPRPS